MIGNARLFQESITAELEAIKDRVRHLIGSRHWGEEGRYKEAVLKNILLRFLPPKFSVGTGFVLRAEGESDADNVLSSQLDIIVYDNTYPTLFSEGDFIITSQTNVKAIIEVKSKLTQYTFGEAMRQFEKSVEDFIPFFKKEGIFAGIFSFGFEDGNIESDRIDEVLKGSKQIVDHICLGSDYFVKWWNRSEKPRLDQIESFPIPCDGDFYNIYNIKKLSYSYFISNLIERLCGDFSDRYWFAFPIEGTKERNRIKSICL